jgi:hypothetical protein
MIQINKTVQSFQNELFFQLLVEGRILYLQDEFEELLRSF